MRIQQRLKANAAQFLLSATLAIVSILLFANLAHAQHPNLIGTWSAKADIMLEINDKMKKVPRELSIKIEKIDGTFFTGTRTWKALTDDPGYVTEANVLGATEPFMGTIGYDGVTLRFVETDDFGMMFGKLLGRDRLEFTYMETHPHAVIYTVVLERQR